MAGGLFAVDRLYFNHIGGFDQGMEIWGSENLELSIKIWLCGGSVEISPCSRVGHVFRPTIPYGFPAGPAQTLIQNANRVAEIWLDEYRGIYYATQINLHTRPEKPVNVQDRIKLRQKLECKDFGWYLINVLPELNIPSTKAEYFGQIHNRQSGWCLSVLENADKVSLLATTCDEYSKLQKFTLTSLGEVKHAALCLTYLARDQSLRLLVCEQKLATMQTWHHQKDSHIHMLSTSSKTHENLPNLSTPINSNDEKIELCLDLDHKIVNKVILTACLAHSPYQNWHFTYHFNTTTLHKWFPRV